jgi:hypothetical protein
MIDRISLLFVLFGPISASFSDISFSSFASGSTGFKILGNAAGSFMGDKATSAGDFNGDGLSDIIFTSETAGKAHVVYGRRGMSAFPTVLMANFTAGDTTGFTMYNIDLAGTVVVGVSGIGDYNNDGIDDVAVGAPAVDFEGRIDGGFVYVIYGRTTGITDIDANNWVTSSTNGFRIIGERWGDNFGNKIVNIGDYNGDGVNDFSVYALFGDYPNSGNNDRGISYMIFGSGSTRSTDLDLRNFAYGTAGFQIYSATGFGSYPAACGDVNNDGYADLALPSSSGTVSGRTANGAVYILFGHSNATTFPDVNLATFTSGVTGVFIIGATAGDHLGYSAGRGGDFNGDGLYDLAIGAQGKAYLLFGRTGVTTYTDIDLASWPDSVNKGQAFTSSSGNLGMVEQIASLGDFNGDGTDDIVLAAQSQSSYTGWGAVLFGHNVSAGYTDVNLETFTTGAAGFRLISPSAGSCFGAAASDAGDVNGDGATDLVVSAPCATISGVDTAGAAYVLYGEGAPTIAPTSQPSRQPTSQPSTQPSVSALQTILVSPTYKVRNGFAFAAIGAGGKVSAWGEAQYGGDTSTVQSQLQSGIASVVGSRFAFAAVTTGGSLALWGVNASTSGLARYGSLMYSVGSLVANEAAFAGVDRLSGRVIAVGSKHHGGDVLDDAYCNGYSAQLSAGVRSITASAGAFAAIKWDSTLLCWGNKHAGADVSSGVLSALASAKMVVATMSAFAVLLSDNSVATWGDRWTGGDASAVAGQLREVHHLTASRSCFVAFKKSSGVVVWGYGMHGGDTSVVAAALSSHVTQVSHTFTAMAAVKADGTVVAWGSAVGGGDATAVQANLHGITRVYGNGKAFAALTSIGGVVAWGRAAYGGTIPSDKVSALSSGVVSIAHTDRAFAALKSDGSVVVWGQAGLGGEPGSAVEALLTSGVHTICANDVAFSAIKTDGSVVAWGHSVSVLVAGVQLTSSSLAADAQCA